MAPFGQINACGEKREAEKREAGKLGSQEAMKLKRGKLGSCGNNYLPDPIVFCLGKVF